MLTPPLPIALLFSFFLVFLYFLIATTLKTRPLLDYLKVLTLLSIPAYLIWPMPITLLILQFLFCLQALSAAFAQKGRHLRLKIFLSSLVVLSVASLLCYLYPPFAAWFPLTLSISAFFPLLTFFFFLPSHFKTEIRDHLAQLFFFLSPLLISGLYFTSSLSYWLVLDVFFSLFIALDIFSLKQKLKIIKDLNIKYKEKLLRSGKEYIRIFENSPGMNIILDKELKIVDCNRKFAEAVGLELEDILRRDIVDFLPETFKGKMRLLKKYLRFHNEASGEFALINRHNKNSIDVFLSAIKETDNTFIIMQDITTIKWMQTSLASYAEQLKKEMNHAKVADKMKSVFLANMSHEIRTPLTSIIGFSTLLKETPLSSTQLDYLHKISNSGEHLLKIINDIIDLSKIEAGKLDIEIEDVNLVKVFNEIHDMMYPKVFKKNIQLTLELEDTFKNNFLRLDGFRLKQVFINLVNNSIKFTDYGHVALKAALRGDEVHFIVEDTGIGIPADKQDRVFEAFVQAEETLSRKYEGTGLGLAISKNLVELMGGKIRLISKENQGTTITLVFGLHILGTEFPDSLKSLSVINERALGFSTPLYTSEPDEDKIFEPTVTTTLPDSYPVLLIGEDNDSVYILLDFILKKNNIRAVRGKDGEEILELYHQYSTSLKATLLDMNLPKIDGITLAKKIRAASDTIKIIGFSAYQYEEIKPKIGNILDGYIKKPFKINEVYDILKKFL